MVVEKILGNYKKSPVDVVGTILGHSSKKKKKEHEHEECECNEKD